MTEKTPWEKYIESPLKAAPGMNGYCGVNGCDRDPWQESPLCKPHAWDVWFKLSLERDRFGAEIAEAMEAAERHAERQNGIDRVWEEHHARWYKPDAPFTSKPGMIYYLQVGEHIKIGFSSNLDSRLKSYPPNSKLLAQHPGTFETERSIHKKFQDNLAMRREWFNPSPELDRHIQDVHQQFPQHNKT